MSVDKHFYFINEAYTKSVINAGGIPFAIPFDVEKDVSQIVDMIDGLLLSGGGDVHPHTFGEEPHQKLGQVSSARDRVELALVEEVIKRKKPIFAICRGHQVLNVALGGSLFQDIYAQNLNVYLHSQQAARYEKSHFIKVAEDSLIYHILGKERLQVNSFHHQAIKLLAPSVVSVAKASDGIIEAIEMKDYPFCLSVQWHPEEMAVYGDEDSRKLFSAFIEECSK